MNLSEKNSFYTKLEDTEKKAWGDLIRSASQKTIKKLGIKYRAFGSAEAIQFAEVDTLALNRISGFEQGEKFNKEFLNEIISFYKENNIQRYFIQAGPGVLTPENKAALISSGFSFYNNWAKLYRDNSPIKEINSDIVVEQIGRNGADDFAEIIINSFGWDPKLYSLFFDFVENDNWINYLGYYNHKPVATASLFIDGKSGWLGFGTTLKEFRNIGAQHALIKQRLMDGLSNGCEIFITETAEHTSEKKVQSFLNLTDMGFKNIYNRANYILHNH